MIKHEEILDFLIIQKKSSFELRIKQSVNGGFKSIRKPDKLYIVGYKKNIENTSIKDGEFICIKADADSYKVWNDFYGALSIYKVEINQVIYLSSSLSIIIKQINEKLSLDYNRLLRYFAFGYQVIENSTHFNKVELYQEPINVEFRFREYSFLRVDRDIFNYPKSVSFEEICDTIEDSILQKTSMFNQEQMLLCMSGGKDSLLSALILKKNDIILSTGTFGNEKSLDIKFGKLRTDEIFNSVNHSFKVEELYIDDDYFFKHADYQSGFGTLASVYFTKFFEAISKLDIKYPLFSEHFEATRKMPRTIEVIRKSYFTPKNVMDNYLLHSDPYKRIIEKSIEMINSTYIENTVEKWYLFDRVIKGQHWKSPIARNFGLIKINLPYDFNWFNKNYNYLIDHGFYYEKITDHLIQNLNLKREFLFPIYNTFEKDIPISPQLMVYNHSNFFVELLDVAINTDIGEVFDIKKIIKNIRGKELYDKDEWFILRLLNLIAFSYKNNISLNFS